MPSLMTSLHLVFGLQVVISSCSDWINIEIHEIHGRVDTEIHVEIEVDLNPPIHTTSILGIETDFAPSFNLDFGISAVDFDI